MPSENPHALELGKYSDEEITGALNECQSIIAAKIPNTLATSAFWKAVENRLKLQRELSIRGIKPEVPVELPVDRRPLFNLE